MRGFLRRHPEFLPGAWWVTLYAVALALVVWVAYGSTAGARP